jgi:hypothetical protein
LEVEEEKEEISQIHILIGFIVVSAVLLGCVYVFVRRCKNEGMCCWEKKVSTKVTRELTKRDTSTKKPIRTKSKSRNDTNESITSLVGGLQTRENLEPID